MRRCRCCDDALAVGEVTVDEEAVDAKMMNMFLSQ